MTFLSDAYSAMCKTARNALWFQGFSAKMLFPKFIALPLPAMSYRGRKVGKCPAFHALPLSGHSATGPGEA